jgi:hypothetical protein
LVACEDALEAELMHARNDMLEFLLHHTHMSIIVETDWLQQVSIIMEEVEDRIILQEYDF